jgi:hypothetical protein
VVVGEAEDEIRGAAARVVARARSSKARRSRRRIRVHHRRLEAGLVPRCPALRRRLASPSDVQVPGGETREEAAAAREIVVLVRRRELMSVVLRVETCHRVAHLTPLTGHLISSITATLFGDDEFIPREVSPESFLSTASTRR